MWTGSEAYGLRSLLTCSIIRHLDFEDKEVLLKLMGIRNESFFCSGMTLIANLAWLNRTDRTQVMGLYADYKTIIITPAFACCR